MSRSVKKGPYVAPELLKRVEEMNKKGEKNVLKTWSRSSTIFPAFVGHTIAVHDGRPSCPRLHSGGHGLVTSWASSLRRVTSVVMRVTRKIGRKWVQEKQ